MVEEFEMFKISVVPFGVQKDHDEQLRKIIYPLPIWQVKIVKKHPPTPEKKESKHGTEKIGSFEYYWNELRV